MKTETLHGMLTPSHMKDLEELLKQRKKNGRSTRVGKEPEDLISRRRVNLKSGGTTSSPMIDVLAKLSGRITEADSGCWEIPVSKGRTYPLVSVCGRQIVGSRFSYCVFIGAVPANLHVCHKCDNPPCVNPYHLFLGSDLDNMRDRLAKGGYKNPLKGEGHGSSILNKDQVIEIRKMRSLGCSLRSIAKAFGVTHAAINLIDKRKNWKHL